MLSAHQIYQDYKENSSILTTKERKLSSVDKPKKLGLKVSTNINQGEKSTSSDAGKFKKQILAPVEGSNEKEVISSKKRSNSSEAEEKWPEIENMYIYEEPEDDYEDILPKSERFTERDIDCFFHTSYIGGQVELTVENIPDLTFEKIDLTEDYLPYIEEEDLYDCTPLQYIPEPSFDDY